MRTIGAVVASAIAALVIVAAVVFVGGDGSVLVPPPAAVVENFVTEPQLTSLAEQLHVRVGDVLNVRAEDIRVAGDAADAVVILELRAGTSRLPFRLRRTAGVWKVADVQSLHRPRAITPYR